MKNNHLLQLLEKVKSGDFTDDDFNRLVDALFARMTEAEIVQAHARRIRLNDWAKMEEIANRAPRPAAWRQIAARGRR